MLNDPLRRDQLVNAETNMTNSTSGVCGHHHGGASSAPAPAPALFGTDGASTKASGMRMLPEGVGQILSALPILAFAFLCHQNSFPIYKELINPNPERMGARRALVYINMLLRVCSVRTHRILHVLSIPSNLKNFSVQGHTSASQ